MVLCVDEDDKRSPFLAGLEDVAADQVLRKRDCVLTDKGFPFLRTSRFRSKADAERLIFHEGRLYCRTVYIRYIRHTGKDTGGVVRHLYKAEINKIFPALPSSAPKLSRQSSSLSMATRALNCSLKPSHQDLTHLNYSTHHQDANHQVQSRNSATLLQTCFVGLEVLAKALSRQAYRCAGV